jgi:GDP-mannose transporter
MAPTTMSLNNPVLSIFAYCASSILMTVSNKYCVSGTGWNLSFFLLAIQVGRPICKRIQCSDDGAKETD